MINIRVSCLPKFNAQYVTIPFIKLIKHSLLGIIAGVILKVSNSFKVFSNRVIDFRNDIIITLLQIEKPTALDNILVKEAGH